MSNGYYDSWYNTVNNNTEDYWYKKHSEVVEENYKLLRKIKRLQNKILKIESKKKFKKK